MESLQLKTNSIYSILKQIDQYFIKVGGQKVNLLRFDVGNEVNFQNIKLVGAFERVLRTSLCQLQDEVSDEFLEKIKLTINKLN